MSSCEGMANALETSVAQRSDSTRTAFHMKFLQIDSSITGENSVSRSLTSSIAEKIIAANPGLQVIVRDLAAEPLSHFDLASLPGDGGDAAVASNAVLEEFLGADIVVIGAPMYNFTLPSQLKAWIDRIMVAGRTFTYSPEGVPVGLAGGKRVIIAVARGGLYSDGSPMAGVEHVETLLKAVFGFIGIEPEIIVAEGTVIEELRGSAIANANRLVAALVA